MISRALPLLTFAAWFALVGCTSGSESPDGIPLETTEQETDVTERLISVSAASATVAWASGTGGSYLRTTDGGRTWRAGTVPGADSLQFRDVHAVSADTAYLLSIGRGPRSRIYKTTDGGSTWTESFVNSNPDAFFDCMDFWTPTHGLAFSDAVDGEFVLVRTHDGGKTWEDIQSSALPEAAEGEGSFAASGTCLVAHGDSTAYFGTGAAQTARVVKTTDRGNSWTAYTTPIEAGAPFAGIASLSFRDSVHGAAMGGVMATDSPPDSAVSTIALTTDGGRTWTESPSPPMAGIFGGTYVPDTEPPILVVTGPEGLAVTDDEGTQWTTVERRSYWGVTFADSSVGWAVGPKGRVLRLTLGVE